MHHIAQFNIAKMKGKNIDDPIMKSFVDQIDAINFLAEKSEGFIWRLKSDNGNATSYNPYDDDTLIINFSVWDSTNNLKNFVYKSLHAEVMRERKKWFENFEQPYYALWKINQNETPSIDEAVIRLQHLQLHGATEYAFDFKTIF
jgi:hypothetical protein